MGEKNIIIHRSNSISILLIELKIVIGNLPLTLQIKCKTENNNLNNKN